MAEKEVWRVLILLIMCFYVYFNYYLYFDTIIFYTVIYLLFSLQVCPPDGQVNEQIKGKEWQKV